MPFTLPKILSNFRLSLLGPFLKWAMGILLISLCSLFFLGWRLVVLEAPEPTLLLLDRHARFLAEAGAEQNGAHGFWPLRELPKRVVSATLGLEDQPFQGGKKRHSKSTYI